MTPATILTTTALVAASVFAAGCRTHNPRECRLSEENYVSRAEFPNLQPPPKGNPVAKFVYRDGEFILPDKCVENEVISRTSDSGVVATFRCTAERITIYDWERAK